MEEINKLVPEGGLEELKLILESEENLDSESEEQMFSQLYSKAASLKRLEMTNLSQSKSASNNERFFNIATKLIEASSQLATLKIYQTEASPQ